jgi:hypothetical protein
LLQGCRVAFNRAIGRWTMTAVVLSVVCGHAQKQPTEPLTVPPYDNVPTTEGYFQGAGGVRLFYRVAGRDGDSIVFLHTCFHRHKKAHLHLHAYQSTTALDRRNSLITSL